MLIEYLLRDCTASGKFGRKKRSTEKTHNKIDITDFKNSDTASSRVRRVLSGQNSRTFKYISRTKLQNSRTFFNLLMCKLNVLINIYASVVDKCGYLFRFIPKCVNLGSSQRSCVTGRNLSIINKRNLGENK